MSERFYFDVESAEETIRDEDGVEVISLDEALAEARSVVAEMADEVCAADPTRAWSLVVRDSSGRSVHRLPIRR
ncbi:hypothetical protein SAMN02799622_02781 [Methylobacterium sp. UNC378MF]|uniref:DUF6894 family protein n=1 Tax=unclassified Methylobacterium TaxID=2615210 RepID=UPI00088D53D8|nr:MULTISPECIES: hypothetical protein [unclassified Methylobacterium]KAA0123427.1 hypothetical protein CIW48_13380 [Methylobacterium sp. P1-11]SDA21582.1 hypothetical protein SAMN02799622_02781 [Methylobacterium sp. UNC378MF]